MKLTGMSAAAIVAAAALGASATAADQPYAERAVKALSEQEVADLKAGHGMGMALPAELNGYPGPRHVLDLAEALALTAEQRAQAQQVYDGMKIAAVAMGEQIVAKEAALDAMFADGTVERDPQAVADLVTDIALSRGALRLLHLRAHLLMRGLLTPEQLAIYAKERGYAVPADEGHGGHQGHGSD
jgi:Spy/CpxP family protein refolding chaperone